MREATAYIRAKMEAAGLGTAAIRAFLYQYEKLAHSEAGLISEDSIAPVQSLPSIEGQPLAGEIGDLAARTVVLKLNGGLGTSMGLEKAKSLLTVRDDLTFLDVIVRQCLRLRSEVSRSLALIFMNSFSTSADTATALQKYPALGEPKTLELMQNKVPKIDVKSLLPVDWPDNPAHEWCPPGHGDIYPSLLGSGLLDRLLGERKEYLFVSNSDNLGATLDLSILAFFANSSTPFLMEVTRRTAMDQKGGHLARRKSDGRLLLRESAQCRHADLDAFQNIDLHRYFNTNTLWIRLDALRAELDRGQGLLPLPLIRNEKTVDPRNKATPKVYQLETAMGAAIGCFEGAAAIEVPRNRFAPVKTTADLLAVRSDAYELDPEFRLVLRAGRKGVPPLVKLDDRYKLVDQLEDLIVHGVPSLARCRSLTIEGNVQFQSGVEIVGDVKFVNQDETRKEIPAGVYEDEDVSFLNRAAKAPGSGRA
jgi:UDP-N-acetylglucosamine pyrophosphorylase